MKVALAVALVFLASVVWAAPPEVPPGHIYGQGNQQSQNQYQGQSQQQSAISSSSVRSTNINANAAVAGAVANAPTTVAPSQTVTVNGVPVTQGVNINPAPVVVQESQRVIPGAPLLNNDTFIPNLQPQSLEGQGAVTRGAPGLSDLRIPGAAVSLWREDGTWFSLSDIEAADIPKDVVIEYTPVKATASARSGPSDRLTIHKQTATRGKVKPRDIIGVGVIKATRGGMSYAQLEVVLMQFAKSKGASGINELDRYATSVTNSKGWNVNAQLGASAIGTLFGQNAVYGPMVGAAYQALTANVEDRLWISWELER